MVGRGPEWTLRAAVARINPKLPAGTPCNGLRTRDDGHPHRRRSRTIAAFTSCSYPACRSPISTMTALNNTTRQTSSTSTTPPTTNSSPSTNSRSPWARRSADPDILLFVNGMPLGQIELKAPARCSAAGGCQPDRPLHLDDSGAVPVRGDHRRLGSDQARVGTIYDPGRALRGVEVDGPGRRPVQAHSWR